MKSRYIVARKWLIFWCLFIGIGAVAGSVGMLVAPDGSALGMQEMLPYFQVLPLADVLFQNYIFPGISLLIVNGLSNLTAAVLLLCRKKSGIILGAAFGVTLMLWICIQFVIFPLNFMSTIYFIFGVVQAGTGVAAYVFYQQEMFMEAERKEGVSPKTKAEMSAEMNAENQTADTEPKTELVVFFSRMGYTRHYAKVLAAEREADLYEVKAAERTAGTLGFWWCGRFGMHQWAMPIEVVDIDFANYEKVTICSPIWVFQLCGPIRSFCKEVAGKIQHVDYILVHFQKSKYENACREMDALLGVQHEHATSICFRRGKEVRRYEL